MKKRKAKRKAARKRVVKKRRVPKQPPSNVGPTDSFA
jgi:hypothetical protein